MHPSFTAYLNAGHGTGEAQTFPFPRFVPFDKEVQLLYSLF